MRCDLVQGEKPLIHWLGAGALLLQDHMEGNYRPVDVEFPYLARFDAAAVGVLGDVSRSGVPSVVVVTSYVVEGTLVVTSTLALIDKASALLADTPVTARLAKPG